MNANYLSKVVPLPRLIELLDLARDAGRSIVQCHGCFDIVHPGHVRHLGFARSQGDVLVVSITSDENIHKGYCRPYVPQELRAENLAALELVDFVVLCPQPTAVELLAQTRPDVYVKGREYETSNDPRFLAERRVVEANGGRVIFSSGDVVFSSTRIVSQMRQTAALEQAKLAGICQRHEVSLHTLVRSMAGMAGVRVTVIGDLLAERHVACDVQDLSTEGPAPRLRPIGEQERLIGAAHLARCARRLGADVRLISAVGRCETSGRVREQLEAEGIAARLFASRDQLLQRTCYLADGRMLFEVDDSSARPTDSVLERQILDELNSAETEIDVLILADLGYDLLTRRMVEAICKAARPRTGFIAAEARGAAGSLTRFRGIDLACPTERQLRRSVNDASSGLSAVAAHVMQTTGAASMICRLGRRGVVAFDGREMLAPAAPQALPAESPPRRAESARLRSEWLPSFSPDGVDGGSAGAVLLTVAALAQAGGAPLPAATYLATAAAALAESDGAPAAPGPAEIIRILTTRPELSADPAPAPAEAAPPRSIIDQLTSPRRTPPARRPSEVAATA